MFTVLALLSGARSYRGVITFLCQRQGILNEHFGCTLKRAPAVNTLRTVLQALNAETLEAAFRQHAKALLGLAGTAGHPVIALDGKDPAGPPRPRVARPRRLGGARLQADLAQGYQIRPLARDRGGFLLRLSGRLARRRDRRRHQSPRGHRECAAGAHKKEVRNELTDCVRAACEMEAGPPESA